MFARLSSLRTVLCASTILIWSSASIAQPLLRPTLDLASARQIAAGCEAFALKQGWHMVVAIDDAAGQLLHFARMDDALPVSTGVAQLKANTAAGLRLSTRQVREAVKSNQGAQYIPGITVVAGGLPIADAHGQVIGSIGVSGGSEDQDEQCAQAGLAAISFN